MYFSYWRKGLVIALYMVQLGHLTLLLFRLFDLFDTPSTTEIIFFVLQLLLVLAYFWVIIFGVISFKFYINSHDVKFIKRRKTFTLEWKDIKTIALVGYKSTSNIKNSMIYFESKNNDDDFAYYSASNYTKYNDNFFAIQYREDIIKEIEKYWDKPIQRMYHVEGKSRQSY